MSLNWLEEFKKKIDVFYQDRPRYMPEFLNTQEKYDEVLQKTDSVMKFEEVALKILADERIDALDFYAILKALGDTLDLVHEKSGIKIMVDIVESTVKYLYFSKKERQEDTCNITKTVLKEYTVEKLFLKLKFLL